MAKKTEYETGKAAEASAGEAVSRTAAEAVHKHIYKSVFSESEVNKQLSEPVHPLWLGTPFPPTKVANTAPTSGLRPLTELDLDRAQDHFRLLRNVLEEEHMNRYVAVGVDDGDCAVADSRLAAKALFAAEHGHDRCCTFHIGTSR